MGANQEADIPVMLSLRTPIVGGEFKKIKILNSYWLAIDTDRKAIATCLIAFSLPLGTQRAPSIAEKISFDINQLKDLCRSHRRPRTEAIGIGPVR